MSSNTAKHVLGVCTLAAGLLACAAGHADPLQRFVEAAGFRSVDVQTLEGDRYYTKARFPKLDASAFRADADLAAPVRALLLMDSHEGAIPHARYLVDWQPVTPAAQPDDLRHVVDIVRINLGAAVRADAVAAAPPGRVAPAQAFGVGPHVRWRFVMSPLRGMNAGLDAASRRVLSDAEAARLDCLGQPCNALNSAEGPAGRWRAQPPQSAPAASFTRTTPHGPAAAGILEQLVDALGEDAQRGVPFAAQGQRLVFVISSNAGGQEQHVTAVARNALVFDDAVGRQWLRYQQVADQAGRMSTLQEPRR